VSADETIPDAETDPVADPDEDRLLADLKSSLGTQGSRTGAGAPTWSIRVASTVSLGGHRAVDAAERLPEVSFATDDWPIPDYEPLRVCGQGAFGEVWIVRDRAGVFRALKILDLHCVRRHHAAVRELEALRRYCSLPVQPHLISIFHIGQTADCLYYTMELADDAHTGAPLVEKNLDTYAPTTLRALLGKAPPDRGRAIEITRELLSGLVRLHEADLAHRDIKPANVVFVGGAAKLADIGMTTEAEPRRTGGGTPGYMPPDFRSDATADTYALSKVLFELLAWPEPVRVPWVPAALRDPDDPQAQRLNDVLVKGCAPQGEDRYAKAAEMLSALDACLEPPRRAGPRLRRIMAALVGVAAIVAGALAWWPEPPAFTHIDYVATAVQYDNNRHAHLLSLSRGHPLRPHDGLSLMFRTSVPAYVYAFCHTQSGVDIVLHPPGPDVAHLATEPDVFQALRPDVWTPQPHEVRLLEGVSTLYIVASATPLEGLADALREQAESPGEAVKPPRAYHIAEDLRKTHLGGSHGMLVDEPPPGRLRWLAAQLGTGGRPRQLLDQAIGRDVIVRYITFEFSLQRDVGSEGAYDNGVAVPASRNANGDEEVDATDE